MRVLLWLILLMACPVLAQGRELAQFAGVPAYSNEDNTASEEGEWQCVEFVKRYLEAKGVAWVRVGNASKLCELARDGRFPGLVFYPNKGTEAPRAGDIIGFAGGKRGHVAVVYEVGELWLKVIEQNWRRDSAIHQVGYAQRGETYVVEDRGSYTCQGWCRMQAAPLVKSRMRPTEPRVAPEKLPDETPLVHVVLMDTSGEVSQRNWDKAQSLVQAWTQQLGVREQGSVVCFAKYAWVVARPQFKDGLIRELGVLREYTPTGEVNLAAGLRLALRQVPSNTQGRITLIAAGGDITDDFAPVVQQCKERGIAVNVQLLTKSRVSHWRNITRVTGGAYITP